MDNLEQLELGSKIEAENEINRNDIIPLAARLRPNNFEEYFGQQHILAKDKLLRRAVESDRFTSIILYGPPGTGKTSLAELIAKKTDSAFIRLSGIVSTVKDIRAEMEMARHRIEISKKRTILFIDEIHRLNKSQQDVLLHDVENGNIRLIGATTYNPNFYVIDALVSRSILFQLEALSEDDIINLLKAAIKRDLVLVKQNIILEDEAFAFLAKASEGDARKALNALEIAVLTGNKNGNDEIVINLNDAESSIQKKSITYGADGHYDTISAFIKSMRGSDPDAAVFWLAKMLHAGEDIRFISRRLAIFAAEDIGNADPRAMILVTGIMDAVEKIGMPEARILLSQATTYCATAPKSNAAYVAIDTALEDVKNNRVPAVPKHLRDAHYKGAEKMGHGEGYKYPHAYDGFVAQEYIGVDKKYYSPKNVGFEATILERIKYWDGLRGK